MGGAPNPISGAKSTMEGSSMPMIGFDGIFARRTSNCVWKERNNDCQKSGRPKINNNKRLTFREDASPSLPASSPGGVEGRETAEGVARLLRCLDDCPPASDSVRGGKEGSSGSVLATKSGSGDEE